MTDDAGDKIVRVVLLGGGHAHLHVLCAFARRPPSNHEVILVSPSARQLYSGMLPGWMAGHFELSELTVDLNTLAARAGVKFVVARGTAIDAAKRVLSLDDGSELAYDILSLDVGSAPDDVARDPGAKSLSVRPLEAFTLAWPELLKSMNESGKARLVVVGAGAAGVEVAFAAKHALLSRGASASVSLVSFDGSVIPLFARGAQQRVSELLSEREISVHAGRARVVADGVQLEGEGGIHIPAEHVILATGGRAPGWPGDSGLALTEDGFVSVDAAHRSVSHPEVFAAGDVSARVDVDLPHSGVHAVRAGPVLAHNLRVAVEGGSFKEYSPRQNTLALLATGGRSAVASWGSFSAAGTWVWYWKRWVDVRFVKWAGDCG